MAKKEETVEMVIVTIAVDNHTHNGIALLRGTQIEVTKQQAEWMLKHHIIEE